METFSETKAIEAEIFDLAHQEDIYHRLIQRGTTPMQKAIIDEQLELIDARITFLQAKLDLPALSYAETLSARRDALYPPVESRSVQFKGIEKELRRVA